tara:strand:- start:147 stop:362 length:216 start_codon:yes stop_codon:yes gene_type:complete
MCKRNYEITPDGEWFKVEVSDEYGYNTTVFEKNVIQASLFIIKWWETSKERKETNDRIGKALQQCFSKENK